MPYVTKVTVELDGLVGRLARERKSIRWSRGRFGFIRVECVQLRRIEVIFMPDDFTEMRLGGRT